MMTAIITRSEFVQISDSRLPYALYHTEPESLFKHIRSLGTYRRTRSDEQPETEQETVRDDKNESCVYYVFIDLPDVSDEFPNAKYTLEHNIMARVEKDDFDCWTAIFEEAGIAMPGTGPDDAVQSLQYEIVYSLESLTSSEDALGPKLKRRLEVLRHFIKVRE